MGSWDKLEIESPERVNKLTSCSNEEISAVVKDLNPTKEELSIALCMAVASHNVDKCLSLLQNGADPNWQQSSSLITLANGPSGFGFGESTCMIFDLLKEFGVEMDQNQVSLSRAVSCENHLLVERMFDSGMVEKLNQGVAINDAARNCDLQMMTILDKNNCITPEYANDAFCCAAEEGSYAILGYLENKIDPITLGHSALERASYFEAFESVEFLLNKGFTINDHDNSFVNTLLMSDNKGLIERVVLNAEKPYSLVSDENVQYSIMSKHPEMMEKLLVSIQDYNKKTFDSSNDGFKTVLQNTQNNNNSNSL